MITGMQCELPVVHIDMFHLLIVSSSVLTVYCSFLKHTSKQKQYIISNFSPGIISYAYLYMYKMHYPWQVQCTERVKNSSTATVTNTNVVTLTEYEVINNNDAKFLALMCGLLFFHIREITSIFFDCLFLWNEKSCI